MSGILTFFTAIPNILRFWNELKGLFKMIAELKHKNDVRRFVKNLDKASKEADETGNTSGYEDIIRGKNNGGLL